MIRPPASLPAWRFAEARFTSLTSRLATLYGGLFAAALIAVAIATQVAIVSHATGDVQAQMAAAASAYDRVWTLRSRMLTASVDIMARDFGFRGAVASGDRETMGSAIRNLADRAGVPDAFILTTDGDIVGEGNAAVRARLAALAPTLQVGGGGVLIADRAAYRLVVAPVLAPDEIGKVVLAVPVDRGEIVALRALSPIPLSAAVMRRGRDDRWYPVPAASLLSPAKTQALATALIAGGTFVPQSIDVDGGTVVASMRALPGPNGKPEAALMLSYPIARAVAGYRPMQAAIALTGIVALFLVAGASWLLARGIARPIRLLDRAARAMEAGDRHEVKVRGTDEIGRLAGSFNAMLHAVVDHEKQIARLAFNDTLTGLPNRVLFREQLDVALKRARARGDAVALLHIDLDGFKTVNDTLGRGFGDALLKTVADMLVALAPGCLVARVSGDEFAIIVADHDGSAVVEAQAQRIIHALAEPIVIDGERAVIGASIGVAVGPVDGVDADALLKNADLSLGRAKADGRGVARFFEPALDAEAQGRREMELDLREALASGQFVLAYQPIFDAHHEHIVCFEALLRWRHPVKGLIPPDRFIPLAEDCGLMLPIGEWVLREACKQASGWPDDIRIAVNVSPTQFRAQGLGAIILQAVGHSGLSPARLEVEITESVFLDGSTSTIAMLHSLRALGIRIALDDFGIGYSSLSYLQRFPFDKIKIDRSFVGTLGSDSPSAAIIDAIVRLAKALGMETTAEGVETADQLEQVRAQGCSSVQGFLFSRPVSGLEANILARGGSASASGSAQAA